MEWKVGKGKLLVCMADLEALLKQNRPEDRAFYQSLLDYMRSPDFNPQHETTLSDLQQKLSAEPRHEHLKELNNISQY